ncbi:MAG: ZIP family metal transporter [Planctomycetota bacterium]
MTVLLTYYCLTIVLASVVGGKLPDWLRLTHRRVEGAVSFVAGVMLGVAVLHLLPHALQAGVAAEPGAAPSGAERFVPTAAWLLGGFLAMFFVERFFCFHHHDAPDPHAAAAPAADPATGESRAAEPGRPCEATHPGRVHNLTWSGAALGLTLHSLLAGVALAASVRHGAGPGSLAGFGAFLAIVLHKPFDSMTIAMLMASGGWSASARVLVNGLFALAIPLGVVIAHLGVLAGDPASPTTAAALAFSAGVFLCISMSDLLPELQFHHHDRVKLSAALLLGLAVAYAACRFETHSHATPTSGSPPQGPAAAPAR